MRDIVHEEDGLTVALVVDDDRLDVELTATDDGPDLSVEDAVVVAVEGKACEVNVEGPTRATATVVPDLSKDPEPMMLMVRVHEFFEGWELFAEEE